VLIALYWLILPISPCPALSLDWVVSLCRKHFPSRINHHIPSSLLILYLIWKASCSLLQKCKVLFTPAVSSFLYSSVSYGSLSACCVYKGPQLRPLASMMGLSGAPIFRFVQYIHLFIHSFIVTWGKLVKL